MNHNLSALLAPACHCRRPARRRGFAAIFGVCVLFLAPATVAAQSTEEAPPAGGALIAASALELDHSKSIAARIRQTGEVLGHPLEGQGVYLQSEQSGEKLLRLEMQLSVGKNRSSVLQVCNLDSLCVRRDIGGEVELTRVLLSEVRDAERKAEATRQEPTTSLQTRGGLPQLMRSLSEHFDFGAPQPSRIGDLNVWVLSGVWKKETLAQLLPAQADAIANGAAPDYQQLPPQMPARVQIVLAREGSCRHFPFRIVYFRHAESTPQERPLMKIEFFEVRRNAQIDQAYFTYNPDDPQVIDITEKYLRDQGLAN